MAKKASKKRSKSPVWRYWVFGIVVLLVILAVILLISKLSLSSETLAGEAAKSCTKGDFSNDKVCNGKKYVSCTEKLKGKAYGDYICTGKKWMLKSIYASCNTLALQIKMFGCKSNPEEIFALFCEPLLKSAKTLGCPQE